MSSILKCHSLQYCWYPLIYWGWGKSVLCTVSDLFHNSSRPWQQRSWEEVKDRNKGTPYKLWYPGSLWYLLEFFIIVKLILLTTSYLVPLSKCWKGGMRFLLYFVNYIHLGIVCYLAHSWLVFKLLLDRDNCFSFCLKQSSSVYSNSHSWPLNFITYGPLLYWEVVLH